MFSIAKTVVDVAASSDGQLLRECVKKIREDSVNRLEEYLSAFMERIEENGGYVHVTRNANDARKILEEIVGNRPVVKSKTNVGKEIGVAEILDIVETDTGDFVASLLGDSGHPILPALGKTPEEIAEALKRGYGIDVPPEPARIVTAIRKVLREKIISAGVGITGANALTADGEIFILENEGNIALVSHVPEVHVVIASIEKVVKDAISAMHVCKALSLFGTGQKTPTYVNIISGPSKTADVGGVLVSPAQGPKELHVILVDNGRSELLNSPYRDVLKCINCGACLSVCPVFHALGNKYGFEHKGTKGIALQRFQKSEEQLFEMAFYCTGCALCREVCPAGVDLPELMRRLRAELHTKGLQTEKNLKMIENVITGGDTIGSKKVGADTEFYCC